MNREEDGMAYAQTASEKGSSAVGKATELLGANIEKLDQLVLRLAGRIDELLVPAESEVTDSGPNEAPDRAAPHVVDLHRMSAHVEAIAARVDGLLQRLAV
jgi:hypothetical protein